MVCSTPAQKRDLAPIDTGVAFASPIKRSFSDSIHYRDPHELQPEIFGIANPSAADVNITRHVVKRDVIPEGTAADRDDFYKKLEETARKIDIYNEDFGQTAIIAGEPLGVDIQLRMEGLRGCLAVFVISHSGMFSPTYDLWIPCGIEYQIVDVHNRLLHVPFLASANSVRQPSS